MPDGLSPEYEAKLTEIFRTLFNDSTLVLRDAMTAADVSGWDSFNHINLVLQVESDFGLRFSTEEIATLKNVGEFKVLIARKLAER
jgi:acyl carrier protein